MSSFSCRTTRLAVSLGGGSSASERRTEMARIVLASFVHFLGSPGQSPRRVMQRHASAFSHRRFTVSASALGPRQRTRRVRGMRRSGNEQVALPYRAIGARSPSQSQAAESSRSGGHGDVSIRYKIPSTTRRQVV